MIGSVDALEIRPCDDGISFVCAARRFTNADGFSMMNEMGGLSFLFDPSMLQNFAVMRRCQYFIDAIIYDNIT